MYTQGHRFIFDKVWSTLLHLLLSNFKHMTIVWATINQKMQKIYMTSKDFKANFYVSKEKYLENLFFKAIIV